MLDLVGNPNCWFSHAQAQLIAFPSLQGPDESFEARPRATGCRRNVDVHYVVLQPSGERGCCSACAEGM